MPSNLIKSLEPIEYKGQTYYRQRDVVAKARPGGANPKEQARYYRDKMALEHGGVWGECLHLPYPDGKIRLTWCVTPEEAEEMAKRAAKKEKRSRDAKIRCIVAKSGEQFYPVIDLVKAKKPWLHYPEDEVQRLRIRLAINGASKRCGRDFYLEEGNDGHAVKRWCVSDWSRFDVERMMEGKANDGKSAAGRGKRVHAGSRKRGVGIFAGNVPPQARPLHLVQGVPVCLQQVG